MRMGFSTIAFNQGMQHKHDDSAIQIITGYVEIAAASGYTPPSAGKTFQFGSNGKPGKVTILAPDGFEVSGDGISYSDTITVVLGAGTAYTAHIRMKSAGDGQYYGNITIKSGIREYLIPVAGYVGDFVVYYDDNYFAIYEPDLAIGYTEIP